MTGHNTSVDADADDRVAQATAHWAPRFIANGTDYADFTATLARISSWSQWCVEWGRTAQAYEIIAERAESDGHPITATGAWRRAAMCWHWGKFVFVDDLEQLRQAHERTVDCYARGASGLSRPAQRVEIPYGDDVLPALLRVPNRTTAGPDLPVVIMAPGLDSVKEELQATAEYLLDRGMATLAVDGPGQGESEFSMPIEPAYEKVASATVDWLTGQTGFDADRIGFFGVSLGGYYAGRAAAYEPRLRASVALCGAYRFDLDWDSLPLLTRATFEHRSGADSAASARQLAGTLTLEDAAGRISAPFLVVHGRKDRLLPAHHAERLSAEAPGAELVMYDDGNHGITNHPFESRSLIADWLSAKLGPGPDPCPSEPSEPSMTDADIDAAVAHWAPRFTTQGVDPNDFRRVTGSLEHWSDWLDAWCANGDMHAEMAVDAESRGRAITAGDAWLRAALSYHFAKFVWVLDMDHHRAALGKSVAALLQAHRFLDPTAERVEFPFERSRLVGNLRRPPTVDRPPLVLLLPGLDSTKEEFFRWENVFLRRGMATFSLDGPGQGESGEAFPLRPDYEVAASAAIDMLAARSDVDISRLGVAGVSMGGYYAARAAAGDSRIRAAVTIGGPYESGSRFDSRPGISRAAFIRYAHASSPDEARGIAIRMTLDGLLPGLIQPLLIIFGRQDRLVPYQQAERMADEAPNAELVMAKRATMCNNLPYRYQPLSADWMADQLSARPAA